MAVPNFVEAKLINVPHSHSNRHVRSRQGANWLDIGCIDTNIAIYIDVLLAICRPSRAIRLYQDGGALHA